MFDPVGLISAISQEAIKIITGKLLTEDQITRLSDSAFASIVKGYLPEPKDRRELSERVQSAFESLDKAGSMIQELQAELLTKRTDLEAVAKELDEKEKRVEEINQTLQISSAQLEGMKKVWTDAVREEAKQGARLRRLVAIFMWLFTLVVGAWAGVNFQSWIDWWARTMNR